MKLRILAFIAIAAMFVIGPANAGFFNAGELLSDCESDSPTLKTGCSGYLAGITDALEGLDTWDMLTGKYFCIPEKVTVAQLRKIFVKHANENLQKLHLAAVSLVLNAFNEAFPCEESSATAIQNLPKSKRSAD